MSLLPAAVDEMIRWVTPVKHFMRNATVDYELAGVTIKEGESVLLSYPSANRDEKVFADPFHFDVGRIPNRHMAFGFGAHFCLGAMFARMEMRALFAELLPRLSTSRSPAPPSRPRPCSWEASSTSPSATRSLDDGHACDFDTGAGVEACHAEGMPRREATRLEVLGVDLVEGFTLLDVGQHDLALRHPVE